MLQEPAVKKSRAIRSQHADVADPSGMRFRDELRRARERAGMTQEQLARRAEITRVYLSQLESGTKKSPSLDVFMRLCTALSIRASEMMARFEHEGL